MFDGDDFNSFRGIACEEHTERQTASFILNIFKVLSGFQNKTATIKFRTVSQSLSLSLSLWYGTELTSLLQQTRTSNTQASKTSQMTTLA